MNGDLNQIAGQLCSMHGDIQGVQANWQTLLGDKPDNEWLLTNIINLSQSISDIATQIKSNMDND
ncbi:hypothetical protein [Sorangium sp. So ce1078]|uniref:hypothetical protein n=1 Tax=Sorangium sp. So ce1078 TaxID=3133329 RepID=UPI003F608F0B